MLCSYCRKLKRGVVTQPRASTLRRCFPFSSEPPGGGRVLAYRVTVSCDSLGSWLICTGKHTLRTHTHLQVRRIKVRPAVLAHQ